MGSATWQQKILQTTEKKVTRVVDLILSRNYRATDRWISGVQGVLASLEVPSREETDALKEEVQSLRDQVKSLSARLETMSLASSRDAQAG